jgi:ribosomal protein L15E
MLSWISKSVSKANKYRGVVYRGIKNIDLKRALGLNKRKQLINDSEDEKTRYRDKFILFTSFTSTSISK